MTELGDHVLSVAGTVRSARVVAVAGSLVEVEVELRDPGDAGAGVLRGCLEAEFVASGEA